MALDTLIERHARYRPDVTAVVCGGERLTYAQFNRRINRLAHGLQSSGIGHGEMVATVLPNCLELLLLYWAVTKIGAVVVPMSPLLKASGLLSLLKDCDAKMVVLTGGAMKELEGRFEQLPLIDAGNYILHDASPTGRGRRFESLVAGMPESEPGHEPVGDEDLFNIVYSSGTTGEPKGIMHPHRVRMQYCLSFASAFRMTPESVVLHSGSIVFNGAFLTLMPAFYLGCTFILHESFDAERWIETVARENVTHTVLVPSQVVAILNSPSCSFERLASLEYILSVGAPLHLEHKKRLTTLLPDRFYELYGLTEGFVTVLDKTDAPRKLESVGCPMPLSEMRIVDESGADVPTGEVGEIIGRGPLLMSGYYKRPDLTAQAVRDGWLYSGDLGRVDEDGFLYLVDRKKDMIISGGVNVYPRDIEEVIVGHPDVAEAAVFGVPDEKWGEAAVAAVVLRGGAKADGEALKKWVNERVHAKFQRVHGVVFLEKFPRNVAGKVLKRELSKQYVEGGGG